jgi:hypothetical protein
MTTRGHFDVGGEAADPIDVVPHDPSYWELRVDALFQLLADPQRRILRADELRWMRESLSPEEFERLSYYERWVSAMARILVEKGVLTPEEISQKIKEIRQRKAIE